MTWSNTGYDVIETIDDEYYFAGPAWNTQIAKRFILKNKRIDKIIESSYYLHLQADKGPVNIAFEPSTSFGCSVGCLFCASGTLAPVRALQPQEISEQIETLIAIYKQEHPNLPDVREDVFYCGIGEPTLMADQLIETSRLILNNHSHMQFKMSTMGAVPKALIQWAQSGIPLRSVQIGIPHWNETRIKHLYNKCGSYNLEAVLIHVKALMTLCPTTAIKINYVTMKDFNDNTEDLKKTVERITATLGSDIELKISCLNPTNFAEKNNLLPTSPAILNTLLSSVQHFNLKKVYVFGPMSDEKLGCGQLAGNYSELVSGQTL